MKNKKEFQRLRAKRRVRSKVSGTSERPRLSVFRSNKYIYAQLIDDLNGVTLASANSNVKSLSSEKLTKIEQAKQVGIMLAEKAKEAEIETAIFDRNGYVYHGRIKALADGAREGGLKL